MPSAVLMRGAQPMFLSLLRRAVAQLSNELQERLSATGLTINQSRILANLAYSPGSSIEAIASIASVTTCGAVPTFNEPWRCE